tara:strand:+ start:100 stop:270 length:171 start_codon:yes stop_codon:yes gene_type:complete
LLRGWDDAEQTFDAVGQPLFGRLALAVVRKDDEGGYFVCCRFVDMRQQLVLYSIVI